MLPMTVPLAAQPRKAAAKRRECRAAGGATNSDPEAGPQGPPVNDPPERLPRLRGWLGEAVGSGWLVRWNHVPRIVS